MDVIMAGFYYHVSVGWPSSRFVSLSPCLPVSLSSCLPVSHTLYTHNKCNGAEHATELAGPQEQDWGLLMEICDAINDTDEGLVHYFGYSLFSLIESRLF